MLYFLFFFIVFWKNSKSLRTRDLKSWQRGREGCGDEIHTFSYDRFVFHEGGIFLECTTHDEKNEGTTIPAVQERKRSKTSFVQTSSYDPKKGVLPHSFFILSEAYSKVWRTKSSLVGVSEETNRMR